MMEHNELALKFSWQLHNRRKDDDVPTGLFSQQELSLQCLTDLRRIDEPMKVLE